jgi:alpha-glucosidase
MPAVMEVPNKTFPMDVRHDYDGNPCSHRKAHNIYGTQMARATYHGGKTFCFPKDLLLLRDQLMQERNATPPHGQEIICMGNLWIAIYQMQRMSIQGWVLRVLILEVLQNNPQGIVCALDSIGCFFILL